jgi:adenine-specific DNA-methyltransferase
MELLKQEEKFVSSDKLLKNTIMESALKLDPVLIKLLLSEKQFREHFFTNIEDITIFDKDKFIKFVSNKQFLPDSYTAFKNKIGLAVGDDKYFFENKEVVVNFPYKDCILVGGQDKEDTKRSEVFYNYTLAPEQVDMLEEAKVFTNVKKYTENGIEEVEAIHDTDNLIIKGNNLFALHSLKKRYKGRIKLIYIDPPYNTGSDSFKYNDSFNHSTWLTFMKNRLEIAQELLSKDGAIFIQIDYHEVGYLNILMNEIFGRDNFIQMISVKTASPAGFKTVNPGPIDVTETILFYTKERKSFPFKKQYVPVKYDENYNLVIENIEDTPEQWNLIPLRDIIYKENGIDIGKTPQQSAKNAKQKWGEYWKIIRKQIMGQYALENSHKVVSIRDPHKPTPKLKEIMKNSKQNREEIFVYEKGDGGESYIINGGALSFYSNKVKVIDGEETSTELLTDLWTDISWDGIAKEGGIKLKNGKKPEKLLKRIIELSTEEGDIVLDYHLGSGTTAAVAHKLGRQYIGIEQLDYGDNDSVIRLQNVINGDTTGISSSVNWQGGGSFIYMDLYELNKKFDRAINECKSKEEALEIFEEMQDKAILDYSFDLSKAGEVKEYINEAELNDIKKLLLSLLDPNHMYLNFSEIEDESYQVSEKDKEINKSFYKVD